jgi:hypothetical protein
LIMELRLVSVTDVEEIVVEWQVIGEESAGLDALDVRLLDRCVGWAWERGVRLARAVRLIGLAIRAEPAEVPGVAAGAQRGDQALRRGHFSTSRRSAIRDLGRWPPAVAPVAGVWPDEPAEQVGAVGGSKLSKIAAGLLCGQSDLEP